MKVEINNVGIHDYFSDELGRNIKSGDVLDVKMKAHLTRTRYGKVISEKISYLIPCSMGGRQLHGDDEVLWKSPSYDLDKHFEGKYGWMPASLCTEVAFESNNDAKGLLKNKPQ